MKTNFWNTISSPIVGLSPMDGVTDASMRFVAKKYGQPDIIYTEFVSAEGLWRIKKRGEMEHKIWNELKFSEIERPVIAQIFGSDPESFYEATKILCELGFDGMDINMGCPSPGLEKRGGGAGLIRDKCNAVEVVKATRRGVEDYLKNKNSEFIDIDSGSKPGMTNPGFPSTYSGSGEPQHCVLRKDELKEIPVSVKTRIGSDKPDAEWWKVLAELELPAVAMHGRTFKQLYSGEANWEVLQEASEVIRESGAKFLGNGDVVGVRLPRYARNDGGVGEERDIADGEMLDNEWGVALKNGSEIDLMGKMDGVLIGREALGNPWALRKDGYVPSVSEKLQVAVEQAKKFEELFNGSYSEKNYQFFPMRKHLACFARGFDGSSGLRKKLMTAENSEQVEMMVNEFLDGEK